MKIYLMRHGETDYNKKDLIQGMVDIPLNETGEEQSVAAHKKIEKISFDAIYASPLCRAIRTGELATGLNPNTFIVDERIREIAFGEAEAQPKCQIKDTMRKFFDEPQNYEPGTGADSFSELSDRVTGFLKELVEKPYENVLVLSHGASIASMLLFICRKELKDFWSFVLTNCCVIEIEYINGKFKLIQIDNS